MPVDPKQFWEDKLLAWEQGRYGFGQTGLPASLKLTRRASGDH